MTLSGFGGISFRKCHRLPSRLTTDKDRASINLCEYHIRILNYVNINAFYFCLADMTTLIRLIGEKILDRTLKEIEEVSII